MCAVSCSVLANGDLEISADAETCSDIANRPADADYWSIWADLFEQYSTNGLYTPFDADSANPFVGLTSAPCVAESMDVFDTGERAVVGRLWWFPKYQIIDPLELLRDCGRVVFALAPQ